MFFRLNLNGQQLKSYLKLTNEDAVYGKFLIVSAFLHIPSILIVLFFLHNHLVTPGNYILNPCDRDLQVIKLKRKYSNKQVQSNPIKPVNDAIFLMITLFRPDDIVDWLSCFSFIDIQFLWKMCFWTCELFDRWKESSVLLMVWNIKLTFICFFLKFLGRLNVSPVGNYLESMFIWKTPRVLRGTSSNIRNHW